MKKKLPPELAKVIRDNIACFKKAGCDINDTDQLFGAIEVAVKMLDVVTLVAIDSGRGKRIKGNADSESERRMLIPCANWEHVLIATALFGDYDSRRAVLGMAVEEYVERQCYGLYGDKMPDVFDQKVEQITDKLLSDLPTPIQARNQEILDKFWSGGPTTAH